MKKCKKCGLEKDESKFYKRSYSDRFYSLCKVCIKTIAKEKRKNNPGMTSHVIWKSRLKLIYGITPDDYKNMLILQGGNCVGCGRVLDKKLSVDHNHTTGKVRGLLCNRCNLAIGSVYENTKTLRSLADYLERHKNE